MPHTRPERARTVGDLELVQLVHVCDLVPCAPIHSTGSSCRGAWTRVIIDRL
jgi:hypothetical protein